MPSQPNMLALILLILASLTCGLCFSLPSEYSILEHDLDAFLSDQRVFEMFQQWKDKYRKMYRHAEEAARRFENFKGNLKYILERNAKKKSKSTKAEHYVGLNKFADVTNEEFRKTYLSKVKKPINKGIARSRNTREVQSCDAPSSLDWRKYGIVTGVKDQGSCGSCWAFSSTGAIEGINALVTRDLVSISEQELVDCDSSNYGCEGGYMDYAFEWVINNGGIDTESDYPYTGVYGTCNTTKKEEAKVVSIDGYQDVEETDSALLCAVDQQPVSVGIDGSSIDFQLYTGGIYDESCSDNPDNIDHAVLIIGYGSKDSEKYWIVKNSWGTSWGINGYFYLKRDSDVPYGVCGVNAMASYPIKESSSLSPYPSPSVPPPPSPSTPPPPPAPPPSPSTCGDFSYCPSDETCCCLFEFSDYCLIYSCCAYENAVCCTGTEYCCPNDYPICDVKEGLCLKNTGDNMGVGAKKRKMAKHKLPWTKIEQTEKTYQTLQWKKNPFAAMR